MIRPRHTGPSKAPEYKGNGRFWVHAGSGSIIPQPLTEEERHIEEHIRATYSVLPTGQQLQEFRMRAGTNCGKPIWIIQFDDGREVESYVGPHELEAELLAMLKRNGVVIE